MWLEIEAIVVDPASYLLQVVDCRLELVSMLPSSLGAKTSLTSAVYDLLGVALGHLVPLLQEYPQQSDLESLGFHAASPSQQASSCSKRATKPASDTSYAKNANQVSYCGHHATRSKCLCRTVLNRRYLTTP